MGNLVTIRLHLTVNVKGSALTTGVAIRIKGLPYTTDSTHFTSISIGYCEYIVIDTDRFLTAYIDPVDSKIQLVKSSKSSTSWVSQLII